MQMWMAFVLALFGSACCFKYAFYDSHPAETAGRGLAVFFGIALLALAVLIYIRNA